MRNKSQVEQYRRRNNRNRRAAELYAYAVLFQTVHNARRRRQSERAAAAQQNGVDAVHHSRRRQQVSLPRAGRGAANVHPANRAILADNDGAAGSVSRVRIVSNANSGNFGYAVCHRPSIAY